MLTKKFEIHPKMIIIWTYENMAHFKSFKVHNFFWFNFLIKILQLWSFLFNVSYIESL